MSPAWLGFPWEHGRGQVANKLSQRPEPVSNPSFASEATLIDLEAANRRVSALAQLSATLSEAVTKEQAIAAVVAGAEEVSGATRAAFVAIDGGRLDLVREEGLSPLLVDYVQQVGVPDESPVAFAARTGETVLLGSPDEIEERFPNSAPLAEATGLLAIANLPIRLGGRVVGVLHVGFDSPHEFTRGEREYLLALASLCAHAVERAEVFDWQSRITRSLMQAETPGQVADLASAEIRTLFGADRIALHMIDPVSGDLVATGHPLGQVRPRRVLGARSSPTSEAVWSGKPVAIVSQEDYRTRYPEAALELGPDGVPMSSLSLPLRFRGDSIGALGFTVPDSQRFSERDVTLAQGLADSVAAALERLRLQDAERGVAVVQAGLARLARVALEAIDQAVFAQKVIEEMCATTGASAAVVYLLDASTDELVRLAATGGSEALLAQPARFPVSTPKAATEALRTGTAVYVDTEEYAKRWPDTLPAYKAEGLESFACLQLAVPDRIIGTMTVGFPERRLFDTDERAVLETFVATAAQGLDRLRLHEAVRLSAERQAAVAGIARFALEATDEVALARKIVDETAAIAHAAAVSVYLLDPPTGDLVLLAMSGWSEESGDRFVRVSPSTRSAAADAIRDLNDIYVQDAEEYARLWPEMIDSYRAERLEASAVLQLAVPERVTGIMSIGFREAHAFDSTERNTLATIAAAAAQGLERLRAQAAERKSLRLLESVVTQMPVGLRILAPDGRVITSNQPAIAPWRGGGEVRSVADYPSWPTFHPDGRPYRTEERPAVRALSGEVVVEEEVTIERFDGTRGVLAVSAAPVRDDAGQIIAGVVITTDITERKDQEASREAFMAVLSHEMRTPMTSISGAARILQVRGNALDVTTRAGLYEDIADEADRMNRMVENLLVLSRVERRMVQPADEPLLLARTMPRLVEAEQVFWPDSTFLLHCTDDRPIVHADVDYLEHIMQNLLSNAAKYAPGEVEVDVAADHASREVIIAVRDHGRGVSSEDASHLFELFWRSPKQTTLARGAGVGLFVVRKLVEAMGGRVWLDESVTDGARFVVALQALDENDWVG